jgi:cytoskeletal protein CcmA (bactofilin family)
MNNLNFSLDFKFQMIFIIFVIFIYFNYKMNKLQKLITENFTDTIVSDQKLYQTDITAIRVLASIAASLNNGGLTTPGNLTVGTPTTRQSFIVNGDSKIEGDLTIARSIRFGKSHDGVSSTISDSLFDPNSLCIVGQGIDPNRKITMWGLTTLWGNSTFNGNSKVNGDLQVTSNLNVGGNLAVGTNLQVNNNLNVGGNLQLNDMYMKYMQAGTYYVKGHGRSMPLYYGWNFTCNEANDQMHRAASRLHLYEKISGTGGGVYVNELRWSEASDYNWVPLKLVLFPGYSARFYYKDTASTPDDLFTGPVVKDWHFIKPSAYLYNKGCVHIIYVTLARENISNFNDLTYNRLENYDSNWNVGTFPINRPNTVFWFQDWKRENWP